MKDMFYEHDKKTPMDHGEHLFPLDGVFRAYLGFCFVKSTEKIVPQAKSNFQTQI